MTTCTESFELAADTGSPVCFCPTHFMHALARDGEIVLIEKCFVDAIYCVCVCVSAWTVFLTTFHRSSVLACQAYVALGLGDPVTALQTSQQLLQMSNLPGGLKLAGKKASHSHRSLAILFTCVCVFQVCGTPVRSRSFDSPGPRPRCPAAPQPRQCH